MGVLAALVAASGPAFAQQEVVDRLDALQELSEKDNAAALIQLAPMWPTFGPSTPYAVRRQYLQILMNVEVDAAKMDAADLTIAKLLKLAQSNGDDVGVVLATAKAASLQTLAGETDAAIARLTALEPVALRTGEPDALWNFYSALSVAQLTAGKFEAALSSALKSQDYAKQRPRHAKLSQLKSLNTLARVYMTMTNWDKSLGVIEDAMSMAQALGSTKMQGTLHLNRGYIYSATDQLARARAAYEAAQDIGREAGLVGLQGTALNNICDGYLRERNYSKAEALCREAVIKFKEAGELGGVATAQANIGLAQMGLGKVVEGAATVRAALQFSKDAGAKTDEEAVLGELGAMYEQLNMYKEAVATIREQQKLTAELFRSDREKAVAALQEQFDSVQRDKQIELLARENSLKDAEISNRRLQQAVTMLAAVVTVMAGVFVFLLYRRVRKTNQKLREANQQLEFHSVRDPLTGLFNRRSFLELMKKRPLDGSGGRRENDNPDGLMILDIDHFKNINDTLGHAGGDTVLVEIAKRLRTTVRDTDMVIRWGGEEFLIYSPKANVDHLKSQAQRVLQAIGEAPIAVGEKSLAVTVTGGFLTLPFSGLPESECNWEKAMQIADMALYLGKVNGRNRAYGLNRLLVPFADAMPVLENDISAALKANMVELVEVVGPKNLQAA
ncbi:MAG: GGDEF domain-containing protein [Rhodoferax sp.]|nr:GGDEF domain-containing protein [Rhodoferax sp.]